MSRTTATVLIAADDSVPFWAALLIGGAMIVGAIAIAVIINGAARGRIGPNPGVGIRTRASRRSETAWRAAHQAAKPFAQFGAVALFVCGVVVLALSSTPTALVTIALVGTGLMVVAMIIGAVVGDRAARAVEDG